MFLAEWISGGQAWEHLHALSSGAWIAAAALVLAVVLGWAAVLERICARVATLLGERRRARRKKEGRGLKYLGLVLLAILPGGLVGTAAVALTVGKKDWRHDAAVIQVWAFPFAGVLCALLWPDFPFPGLADNVFVTGGLGLVFALLQLWALLKLLREAWGEPARKVAWWPPLALWLQTAQLVAVVWLALRSFVL